MGRWRAPPGSSARCPDSKHLRHRPTRGPDRPNRGGHRGGGVCQFREFRGERIIGKGQRKERKDIFERFKQLFERRKEQTKNGLMVRNKTIFRYFNRNLEQLQTHAQEYRESYNGGHLRPRREKEK